MDAFVLVDFCHHAPSQSVVSLLLCHFYGKSSLIAFFSVAICPFLFSLFFLWLTHREADWGTEVPWYFSSAPWPLNPDWLLQHCCREHHKWYQLCSCPMLCPQKFLHMSSFPFFSLTSLQSQAYHLGKEQRRCSSFFSVLITTSLYYCFTLCLCSKGRGVCGLTDSWFGGSPAPETFGPARAHSCQCARLASWTSE